MDRPRAADDFKVIRARLEELRREREEAGETELRSDPPPRRGYGIDPVEISARRSRSASGQRG
jgi:hypothetical protein